MPKETSHMGLSDNVVGGIAYIPMLAPIPAIIFLIFAPFKKSLYVRFYSWQSILLVIANIAIALVCIAISMISFNFIIIIVLESLVFINILLVCMVGAFYGKRFKLPLLGDLAEKLVGKQLGVQGVETDKAISTDETPQADAAAHGRFAATLLYLAGPLSLGIITADFGDLPEFAVIVMFFAFVAAALSIAGPRKPAEVCTSIFVAVTGIFAIVGLRHGIFGFLIHGGVGCILGLYAIWNLRNAVPDGRKVARKDDE